MGDPDTLLFVPSCLCGWRVISPVSLNQKVIISKKVNFPVAEKIQTSAEIHNSRLDPDVFLYSDWMTQTVSGIPAALIILIVFRLENGNSTR